MNNILRKAKDSPASSGFILLVLVIIINILIQGVTFFGMENLTTILTKNLPLVLIACAQFVILTTGCIDLSIGYQMSLANVIAIMAPKVFHIPLWEGWLLAFLAVVLCSTINGIIIAYFRIPPLLATFGTGYVLQGINLLIMSKPQGSVPEKVYKFYDGNFVGIPNVFLILVVILIIWYIFSRYSLLNKFLSVGGNERNVYVTGISVSATIIKAYAIAGIFTALSGIAITAMAGSGNPLIGESFTLRSVAACVLGGASITGGVGSIYCAISGGFFLAVVQNIVFFLFQTLTAMFPSATFNSYYQSLVSDSIILLGLLFSTLASNKSKNKKGLKSLFIFGKKDGGRL